MTVAITAQEIADTLITSERERKGIAQFSDENPEIPVETAFEAQKLFVQSKLDAGETFVGWKLGLTSKNKQQAMGLAAPLYGRVTSGMNVVDRIARGDRILSVTVTETAREAPKSDKNPPGDNGRKKRKGQP